MSRLSTEGSEPIAVRTTTSRPFADEWALVLTSAGIPCEVRAGNLEWVVLVPADREREARTLFDVYERESRGVAPTPTPPIEYGRSSSAVIVAAALVVFYAWLAASAHGEWWYDQGAATARRIAEGEWWRTVTALTLHASIPHVAGNALAFAILGTGICREVGPGVGLWLVLLAGAGGNALNATLRGGQHSAVGASTAIFGAVGILGTLQVTRRYRTGRLRRAWVPLAAAFGLLALLGTGKESDVLAHLFGFLVGSVLGVTVTIRSGPPLRRWAQWLLLLGAAGAVAACWWAALTARTTHAAL
jgi:membrane associated rhomboid family serine protease